jgi:predicted  nucleic acid-binding Zn-ribbon protein
MKRAICTLIALALLALLLLSAVATGQTAPAADEQAVLLKQMAAEIKQLRLEIIKQAIEFQDWKLKQLERELFAAQSEQQRLREQTNSLQQQLAGLASHDASTGAEQLGELEIIRATHSEDGLKPLQLKQQALAEREAELREEINREKLRLQELQQMAEKLRAI